MIQQKRYQRFTANGIEWSEWFDYDGPQEPWQLNNKLKNEYRVINENQEEK